MVKTLKRLEKVLKGFIWFRKTERREIEAGKAQKKIISGTNQLYARFFYSKWIKFVICLIFNKAFE